MNEQLISLDCLDSNPYQPRQSEDFNVVLEIAMNILGNATPDFDGLLQAPTVRPIAGGRYQLAFGHTRKAAFAELVNQGHERYSQMRVYVRELSDVQMFEMAVAENIKRRDLNPIEQAESMRRYMDEFGKTSVEAGEFFGVSEETIRAKVRLGNLPEPLKEKVRAGELNENAARSALTMTRILPKDEIAVREFMRNILEDGDKPEYALEQVLRSAGRTKIIGTQHSEHFSVKAKTFKYLPELTLFEAVKDCGVTFETHQDKYVWENRIEKLSKGEKAKDLPGADDQESLEIMEKIAHLVKPPACTTCPFFAQIDGLGYCGWAACFERKKEAANEADLHNVSESTGIAIYSQDDGDKFQLRTHEQKHRAAYDKKHKDLRLLRGGQSYMNFGDIPNDIKVVAVGDLCKAWKKAEEQSRKDSPRPETVDYERQRAVQRINEAQISLFAWDQAVPAFSKLLDGVTCIDLLHRIDAELNTGSILDFPDEADLPSDKVLEKMKKPARLDLLRKRIIFQMLDQRMDYHNDIGKVMSSKKPVSAFAKYLQGLAVTWGVKLPKDFVDQQTATYDEAIELAIAELDQVKGKVTK